MSKCQRVGEDTSIDIRGGTKTVNLDIISQILKKLLYLVKGVYIRVMPKMIKKEYKDRAIDVMGTNPNLDLENIANVCGVSLSTLNNWRKEPAFNDAVYERYMSTMGIEQAQVNAAMVREAKLGNVQAARFCAEINGKMVKRISIKHESPYDQFLKTKEIDDAEIIDTEVIEDGMPPFFSNDKPRTRTKEEKKRVDKILNRGYKKEITPEQRAKNRKKSLASYRRLKRAKKVGLEPLGRKTGEAKRKWYAELEKREKEMGIKA
tara:strand:- start:427 stop:1215 length:789 start_codon:yes stop_codon:yes gene_type:complete